MGANASFFADPTSGIAITNPTLVTTAGGWAQTTVTAPSDTATTPSPYLRKPYRQFHLERECANSGGNTGGNGNPQMSIYAGDGQLLRAEYIGAVAIDGQDRRWEWKSFGGRFCYVPGHRGYRVRSSPHNQGLTDQDGLARADYSSASIPQNASIKLSKISATSIYGTLEFFETTHCRDSNDLQPG